MESNDTITSLVTYNSELYAGIGRFGVGSPDKGHLYKWNQENPSVGWTRVAAGFIGAKETIELVVFDNKIYAGTGFNGKFLEWNGVDTWQEISRPETETGIYSFTLLNNELYAGTGSSAKLYKWGTA